MPRDYVDFAFAYEFADAVAQAVRGPAEFEYIHDFIEADPAAFWERASLPRRDSLLHGLIRSVNLQAYEEAVRMAEEDIPLFEALLAACSIPRPQWLSRADVRDHREDLDSLVDSAVSIVSDATFQLLFSDLPFLAAFHDVVADMVDDYDRTGWENCFRRGGALKRPSHVPTWLRRAVFYRDRGRCRHCERDLTGTISVDADIHVDHLRPLASSGTNDPTNFQLLCASCNLRKGALVEDGPWWSETYW